MADIRRITGTALQRLRPFLKSKRTINRDRKKGDSTTPRRPLPSLAIDSQTGSTGTKLQPCAGATVSTPLTLSTEADVTFPSCAGSAASSSAAAPPLPTDINAQAELEARARLNKDFLDFFSTAPDDQAAAAGIDSNTRSEAVSEPFSALQILVAVVPLVVVFVVIVFVAGEVHGLERSLVSRRCAATVGHAVDQQGVIGVELWCSERLGEDDLGRAKAEIFKIATFVNGCKQECKGRRGKPLRVADPAEITRALAEYPIRAGKVLRSREMVSIEGAEGGQGPVGRWLAIEWCWKCVRPRRKGRITATVEWLAKAGLERITYHDICRGQTSGYFPAGK